MKSQEMKSYQKETQKDYSLAFKLELVDAIEKGEMTYSKRSCVMVFKGEVPFWFGCENMVDWIGKNQRT